MSSHICHAQNFGLDTREITDLVKKWNYANNWKSEETFRNVYARTLLFYTETLSREQCIAIKRKFFREHPEFKQKIVSDPVFTPYTSGIIKCEFTKEVYQDGAWKKYPSYLLISYENKRYVIAGESDRQTDRVLQYNLDIKEPMDIPQSKKNTVATDPPKYPDSANESFTDSLNESLSQRFSDTLFTPAQVSEDSTLLTEVYKEVLSEEAVTVPKKYLYFLIGFLILLGSVVLFSRQGRSKKIIKGPKRRRVNGIHKETHTKKGDSGFENFVVRLFDPHYFTISVGRRQTAIAGNGHEKELLPHIDLGFHNKDTIARFAVACLYIPRMSSVYILSRNQMKAYHDLQEESGTDVYLIIGLGGEPEDPKEIYLIRTGDLRTENVTYTDLQPFRKSGMVFYSTATKRLR